MVFLNLQDPFPPVETAGPEGLLAAGLDLSVERIIQAYSLGIFPWYSDGQPVLWWSPDPRMVLFPENLHISKSMRRLFKKNSFSVTYNQAFKKVMAHCAGIERKDQEGTWITSQMKQAYLELHKMGWAHSVEVWQKEELVGGLYGIYLKEKQVFCGESMFSRVSNASKYGFISLVQKMANIGIQLIDCQVHTPHLESLGAKEIPRKEFLRFLK